MRKALQIILGIQLVLGMVWTLSLMSVERTSWANVYLFFYTYPFHLIFMLVGLWALFRHKDLRKLAGCIVTLPIVLLFVPGMIRSMAGGPVSPDAAIRVLFVIGILGLVFAVLRPRQVTRWIPDIFYQSRAWNAFVVVLQLIGWVAPFILVAIIAADAPSRTSNTSSGTGIAVLLVLVATYIIGLGVFALITSIHAWLGLRGGVDDASRGLHITQLVLGVPGIALGVLVFGWMIGQQ